MNILRKHADPKAEFTGSLRKALDMHVMPDAYALFEAVQMSVIVICTPAKTADFGKLFSALWKLLTVEEKGKWEEFARDLQPFYRCVLNRDGSDWSQQAQLHALVVHRKLSPMSQLTANSERSDLDGGMPNMVSIIVPECPFNLYLHCYR
jgi:hypothetical protein